jgi:hypothetical protein
MKTLEAAYMQHGRLYFSAACNKKIKVLNCIDVTFYAKVILLVET